MPLLFLHTINKYNKNMPNFKKMHEFVSYVNAYNTKDVEEDGTLNNLVDPNYYDIKAIKEDNALRNFRNKKGYREDTVADIYRDAKSLGYLKRRDGTNSTHVQGIGIVLSDEGRHFIEISKFLHWKKGKWHAMAQLAACAPAFRYRLDRTSAYAGPQR